MLLFSSLIGSGELCSSSRFYFTSKFICIFMSDAPVGMSWQLPDYSIFVFVCLLVPNYVFSTV